MKALIKWPGGKERELPVIMGRFPDYSGRYIEPFVGGGAVFLNVKHESLWINDKSAELIRFYRCVRAQDEAFLKTLRQESDTFRAIGDFVSQHREEADGLYQGFISTDAFLEQYGPIMARNVEERRDCFLQELWRNLEQKISRVRMLEAEHGLLPESDRINTIEAALKSAYYMYLRTLYNHPGTLGPGQQAAVFFFVREYCYSSMFRYNAAGEFNVPYGGISYNRKDFQKKIDYLCSDALVQKLRRAEIRNQDFEAFIRDCALTENDFIFLDPPYDSEFSTYAQNTFGREEQIRLCECLKKMRAKWMLVIKNTEFINGLYQAQFHISSFEKRYAVSFKNRNDQKTSHLIITNYE